MANEALVRKSTLAVKKETQYNTDPSITSANVIRFKDLSIDDEYEEIQVDEVYNSKNNIAAFRGAESVPLEISLNLRGCGTPGTAPEGDPLFEAAWGVQNQSTGSTCAAASTTTLVKATSGAGFSVGDAIAVIVPTATTYTTAAGSTTTSVTFSANPVNFNVGDVIQIPNTTGTSLIEAAQITDINRSTFVATITPALTAAPSASQTVKKASIEVVWVTSKATNDLSISPALSAAPDQYTALKSGTFYKFTLNELPSVWVQFWRGDVVLEKAGGCKVDSFELDVSVGAVAEAKFTVKGISFSRTAGTYGLGAPTYIATDPIVGVSQIVKIGGVAHPVSKFAFKIDNEIYDDKDITSPGMSNRLHMARKISGSFSLLYRSTDIYNLFRADTRSEAIIVLGRRGMTAGNAVAIRIPNMRYTKVPVTADGKIYKYDVTWEADMGSTVTESVAMMACL